MVGRCGQEMACVVERKRVRPQVNMGWVPAASWGEGRIGGNPCIVVDLQVDRLLPMIPGSFLDDMISLGGECRGSAAGISQKCVSRRGD